MASARGTLHPLLPNINSLPNLRLLCHRSSASHDAPAAIYRSSRPDRITAPDMDRFKELGIQCLVDLRSVDEYLASDGHRLLDQEYLLYKVIIPKHNYQPGQAVKYELVSPKNNQNSCPGTKVYQNSDGTKVGVDEDGRNDKRGPYTCSPFVQEKRHYFINFFSSKYIRTVLNRLPWHLWCLGILYLVWDVITRNKMKRFRKFVAVKAVSAWGMFGQYVDIIEVSQPAICSALKLLSDPHNLPAVINCAYGKDRTGIISALILTLLNVPKDNVAKEYSMSTEGLNPIRHNVYSEIVQKHFLNEEFCKSEAITMINLLTYIEDRYHSVEQYLASIGFTEQEQRQLKSNLEAVQYRVV